MVNFDFLSTNQRVILDCESHFCLVRACPGSGKTYTAACWFLKHYQSWEKRRKGIAILSFTNVACDQFSQYLSEISNIEFTVHYPHFLGTLDSFLNNYILLPFGHKILNPDKRPILVGEPFSKWNNGFNFYAKHFDNIRYNIEGVLSFIDVTTISSEMRENHMTKFLNEKARINRLGFVTQSDANYFSLRILQEFPEIAKSVASRFPFILLDEAQDTTDIQMKILQLIIEAGVSRIMLIGDPDQAIYQWNHAKPDLFMKLHDSWRTNDDASVIVLNENRRSSQLICTATYKLSSLDQLSTAVTPEVRDIGHDIEFYQYTNGEFSDVIDSFIQLCVLKGITITKDRVAVVGRSQNMVDAINGRTTDIAVIRWLKDGDNSLSLNILDAVNKRDSGSYSAAFKKLEHTLYKLKNDNNQDVFLSFEKYVKNIGFRKHRAKVRVVLSALPSLNLTSDQWFQRVKEVLDQNDIPIDRVKALPRVNLASDILVNEEKRNYHLGTVHSIKGMTFDAVLLILKTKAASKRSYERLLGEFDRNNIDEELRIAYVALTRPRKLLALALPTQSDRNSWLSFLT